MNRSTDERWMKNKHCLCLHMCSKSDSPTSHHHNTWLKQQRPLVWKCETSESNFMLLDLDRFYIKKHDKLIKYSTLLHIKPVASIFL